MATIRYIVHDVDACVDFYIKHLGFALTDRMGTAFAIVSRDDLDLWLSGPQTSAARAMPDGRVPGPGGWNRIVIEVQDIESRVAAMRSAGVTFRNDIISGPGGRQVLAEDPAGNAIEIFQKA